MAMVRPMVRVGKIAGARTSYHSFFEKGSTLTRRRRRRRRKSEENVRNEKHGEIDKNTTTRSWETQVQ